MTHAAIERGPTKTAAKQKATVKFIFYRPPRSKLLILLGHPAQNICFAPIKWLFHPPAQRLLRYKLHKK
jgi:hypothetical protein